MIENISKDIEIQVETVYLPSESAPDDSRFIFAYTITIENKGSEPAQLMTRRWVITDSNGRTQEVQGEGVVGAQPYIKPGEGFQYTSGAMLETPTGTMEGAYHMVTDEGLTFEAEIKPFTLAAPQTLH